MWDLPGPGLEPMSPALAGGFLTTVPPGKPQEFQLNSVSSEWVRIFVHILLYAGSSYIYPLLVTMEEG